MLKQFLSLVLCPLLFGSLAFGGDNGPGGNPNDGVKQYLRNLIENPNFNLKHAMENYLRTLPDEKVVADSAGLILVKNKARYFAEIEKSPFTIGTSTSEGYCLSSRRTRPAAMTDFQVSGAVVQFDLERLYSLLKDRSPEVQMVEVAALAFHELTHHLQDAPSRSANTCGADLQAKEKEANEVAAYVVGNVSQAPFMQWAPPRSENVPAPRYEYCMTTDHMLETPWYKPGGGYYEALCTDGHVRGKDHFAWLIKTYNAENAKQKAEVISTLRSRGFQSKTSLGFYTILSTAPAGAQSYCIRSYLGVTNHVQLVCTPGVSLTVDAAINLNEIEVAQADSVMKQSQFSKVGELLPHIILYRKDR